jgi:hypothetical protein
MMDAIEQLQRARLLQERQMVPAPQAQKQPVRHGGQGPKRVAVAGLASERRRDQRIDDARVEAVAPESHATRRQYDAVVPGGQPGPDAQERKIAGAAAEVGHQDQLFVVEAGRIAKGGGDRLQLEDHLRETSVRQGGAHPAHGAGVVIGIASAPVTHRAPDDGPRGQRVPDGGAKLFEVRGDEALQRPEATADHRAGERGAGQVRLDRLDEAPLPFVLHVPGDGRRASQRRRVRIEMEDRPPGLGGGRLDSRREPRQVGQGHLPFVLGERKRGVGGPEVDPDVNGHLRRSTSGATARLGRGER